MLYAANDGRRLCLAAPAVWSTACWRPLLHRSDEHPINQANLHFSFSLHVQWQLHHITLFSLSRRP